MWRTSIWRKDLRARDRLREWERRTGDRARIDAPKTASVTRGKDPVNEWRYRKKGQQSLLAWRGGIREKLLSIGGTEHSKPHDARDDQNARQNPLSRLAKGKKRQGILKAGINGGSDGRLIIWGDYWGGAKKKRKTKFPRGTAMPARRKSDGG